MQWLNRIVDEIIARRPDGEILIESGGSPSGTYHLGHMRELVTCDAIMLELRRRGRQAKHIYFTDDLDAFRKVPVNVPINYEQYLGMPLCDIPAPDGSKDSYANYFLGGLMQACRDLGIEVEFILSHEKYRTGFFVPAIERCMERIPEIRYVLESISNRQLSEDWTPIQVMEDGLLKNRKFIGIDTEIKKLAYEDVNGQKREVNYQHGEVKLDWRLDWPGRWWLLKVDVEPFGREHASASGSYDTGKQIIKDVYDAEAPLPIPYDSINMVGDTKKMSASKGTAISATEGLELVPSEVLRYFILNAPLNKRLYFDPINGVIQLMDEFAVLAAKPKRTDDEEQLFYICTRGLDRRTVSRVPFSHLVASYQAALKNPDKTLEIIGRTEYAPVVTKEAGIIKSELLFIDAWLVNQAPESVKFELLEKAEPKQFSAQEQNFLKALSDKVTQAPTGADGAWFHQAVYEFKDTADLSPQELFSALYKVLIGKTAGPRAGWFLSILPRDWLIKRLRFEV